MTQETFTILEAYKATCKAKITDTKNATSVKPARLIKEEEQTPSTTTAPVASGSNEPIKDAVIKEAGEVASKPGSYTNFTGTIKTPGIYGKVENAKFTIEDNETVSWSDGTWLDGAWASRTSTFNGGTWKNGTWKTGYFGGGVWEDGIHKGGVFAGGTWKNGKWEYGVFDEGTWEDGMWVDGDWSKDAKWIKGRDSKGVEHTDAPFHWGGMKYTKVTDPSADALKKEKSKYAGGYSIGKSGIDTFDDDSNPGEVYGKLGLSTGMKKSEIDLSNAPRAVHHADESCISEATKKRLGGLGILGKMVNSVKMIKVKKVIGEEDETTDEAQIDEKKKKEVVEDPLDIAIANFEKLAIDFEEKQDLEAAAVNRQLADWLKELKVFKTEKPTEEIETTVTSDEVADEKKNN